ncbi:hypothetical protein EVAR_85462_1 [Eumeta japonica]|uniref:Uncharacterized protein n=1 Tax=Eumeta variegata TaxID=151549 RepID=A0A4C1VEY9_EUMVA|nr:hypothetical protein EVAR_85462_1 [Eumeta japonica]
MNTHVLLGSSVRPLTPGEWGRDAADGRRHINDNQTGTDGLTYLRILPVFWSALALGQSDESGGQSNATAQNALKFHNDTASMPAEPKNCTTPKGAAGVCTGREHCDYGTPAIDFTLYAPKGYRR